MSEHKPDMSEEIFDFFLDDPDEIQKVLVDEDIPVLCMVLNNDLSVAQTSKLGKESYIFFQDYLGEQRYVVAGGLYKEKQKRFDKIDSKLTAKCNAGKKWVNAGSSQTRVLLKKIDDPLGEVPLCIVINPELEEDRLKMMKSAYEIIRLKWQDGEVGHAIACVYLDRNYDPPEKLKQGEMQIAG